jgi:hypothetical protein
VAGFDRIVNGKSSHEERLLAMGFHFYLSPINPPRDENTATINFHNKVGFGGSSYSLSTGTTSR